MYKRVINIAFDLDGKSQPCVGSVVRLNHLVNVIRIHVDEAKGEGEYLIKNNPDIAVRANLKRQDGETGTMVLARLVEGDSVFFELTIPNWATAIEGELRISFAIVYPETIAEFVNGNTTVEIYPVDYQRQVVLIVEPSIDADSIVDESPDMANELLSKIEALEARIRILEGG